MKKEKILIIDDSKMMLELLKDILKQDYEVYTICVEADYKKHTSSDINILDKVKNLMPSLILLDIIMPRMNGFEIIKELKSNRELQEIPVIFLTGLNDETSEEMGLQLGAVDYITKPFKPSIVRARVKTHVKLYRYQRKIETLTFIDELTNIDNRRAYDKYIKREWKRHMMEISQLSLMMIDVDFFKCFNDSYGHQNGDQALYLIAQAMQETLPRVTDSITRYGGEEFAVILPNTSEALCKYIANKLLCQVRLLKLENEESQTLPYVTISIGAVTAIPNHKMDLEDFVHTADMNLYAAKNSGRNQCYWSMYVDEINGIEKT